MTLSSFLKVHPPTFRGTSSPTDADNWIQAIERALQAQQVPDEQWIEFGTYQLQGEAQHWWQGMRRILQPDRICKGAPEDFADWKCIKYEGGLRSDILSFIAMMKIRTFSELVNKTRVAEECLRNVALDKSDHRSSVREDHGRKLLPRGQDFKRGGNTPKQHQGQSSFRRFNDNNNQGKGRKK
ncbi:uncharacterized protein LOC130974692 [Arachis stenosperma]|uniref:uncharacterized protein LOC130974692 n=1 Tax=Arachis stenosperma TaxID=217475 RepID=UPI0025ABDFDC|nr:uncharacterized protein LOC130974692 [Arachis stenosperma]